MNIFSYFFFLCFTVNCLSHLTEVLSLISSLYDVTGYQSLCSANNLISSSSCPSLMTLRNTSSSLFLLSPLLQVLGFPCDDLTAVSWPRPRCNEGPLLLLFLFHLSSQLPPPLPVLQNLRGALFPIHWPRVLSWIGPVLDASLQAAALLSANGATPHCQHAAAEAQLTLPKPCQCLWRTLWAWRASKRLWTPAAGSG